MNVIGQEFQPIAAIATTPTGAKLLQPICQKLEGTLWIPESCRKTVNLSLNTQVYTDSLKNHLANIWLDYNAIIFSLASGAVIRLISPLLQNKYHDPAVVIVDQTGKFVISLCSGHQGGADQLTNILAPLLNATPVITGASHNLELPGIDILGKPFGWQRGEGDWNTVSGIIAREETVQVLQEVGSMLWQKHLPHQHPFYFGFPKMGETSPTPKARIWINFYQHQFSPDSDLPKVQWHPRVLWVGVGCERGTSKKLIATGIEKIFSTYNLAVKAIAGIATINIKADEIGLIEFCQEKNLPLQTFSAELLNCVEVPNPSDIVAAEVGTTSVSEAAAILAAKQQQDTDFKQKYKVFEQEEIRDNKQESKLPLPGEIQQKKKQLKLSTNLLVSKEIFRLEGEPGAMTIAIALSEKEYTGRTGKLLLIGTGPGQLDQITSAAKTAISYADVVIGYSLYIDLIQPLFNPGQIVEKMPITQERQRAERAIELANFGLTVAVVSSGDSGIYGMAGLVLEQLRASYWDSKNPAVEIFPGISALQSAASRVGVPLMHDFCAISLSDLLTPWEVIEKRLIAAATADFVVAIYNPKSQKRTEQLVKAVNIFLKYRQPKNPVAVVRSAYRENEEATLTTLDKLLEVSVDMLTVILIGNQSTGIYNNWMITPRGYLG
ncbi:MAG: precorrin-3B C(17)-methyltransferase [Trichodesmium sp. St18_bin3_1_1]|nr:precorrin-3B C(17)-methyltransferase [Trichodesmium sp. St18_bin3_1_1]